MEIVAIINPELKDEVLAAVYSKGVPLTPMFSDLNEDQTDLARYYHVLVQDGTDSESEATEREMSTQVLQILSMVSGIDAAYCKPKAELAGWVVQEP